MHKGQEESKGRFPFTGGRQGMDELVLEGMRVTDNICLFEVRLLLGSRAKVAMADEEREFRAMLSYDEYQEFTAGLERLKESGKLRSYSVRPVPEEGWFDIDMCNAVVQMVKDLEAYPPGESPRDKGLVVMTIQ
jgi:hypothetical protein